MRKQAPGTKVCPAWELQWRRGDPLVAWQSKGRSLSSTRHTRRMVWSLPCPSRKHSLWCCSLSMLLTFAHSPLTVASLMSAISVSEGKVAPLLQTPAHSPAMYPDLSCCAVQCQVHGPQTANGGCAHHRATYSSPEGVTTAPDHSRSENLVRSIRLE